MKYEELSNFNQQLAAMISSGLPLEGALREVAASMKSGPLKAEAEALERDLAAGIPLDEAIGRRKLPEFYVALVRVGIKGNDLPGTLTMLADHYRRLDTTWTRLKGLLVYPGIVLVTALLVSGGMALLYSHIASEASREFGGLWPGGADSKISMMIQLWLPVALLGLGALVFFILLTNRRIRNALRWRVPGFREASIAQLASGLAIMLENGCDMKSALQLLEQSEPDSATRNELGRWRERIAGGARQFTEVARGTLVPRLFIWLVASSGENWAAGFRRAADVYSARANYRIELALYAALPISILIVTAFIATELAPVVRGFVQMMNALGGDAMMGE